MSDAHSRGVTKHYLKAANTIPDGYWDDVFREKPYYENTVNPAGETLSPKGREVGEFDVLLVNYENKDGLYIEVKTDDDDLYYAEDQIERAEDFYEDTEWDVIGHSVLEE
jgi:hypothetical protein